jgi:hypothetical protein
MEEITTHESEGEGDGDLLLDGDGDGEGDGEGDGPCDMAAHFPEKGTPFVRMLVIENLH